jgi:hypothetical protein
MKVGDLIKVNMGVVGGGQLGILISILACPQQFWRISLTSGTNVWLYLDEFEVQNESR